MRGAVPPAVADRLAQECRVAAASLLRLQETLGLAIPTSAISSRLVEDLQTLDTVAQTMDDLGAVFGAIAAWQPAGNRSGTMREALLASVSQASLRERLAGSRARDAGRDVDLF